MNTFHLIEFSAAAIGIVAVFLQIKVKPSYWPVSIINVLLYIYVYFKAKLYAEITLQSYYLIVSVYGWLYWKKSNNVNDKKIETTKFKEWLLLFIIFTPVGTLLAYFLIHYSDTDVPVIDSIITTLSFMATYLLARKKIENWLLWIFIDASSIALYIYKQLYFTIVLFSVLTVLAIIGYRSWKKILYATH